MHRRSFTAAALGLVALAAELDRWGRLIGGAQPQAGA